MFPESDVRLKGDPATYCIESDTGNIVTRFFCGTCGSPLFGKNTGMPGFMTVAMGTLDAHEGLSPQVAIFTRSRRHWDLVDPMTQAFDTQPNWKPNT
jgi:hypothetical protein